MARHPATIKIYAPGVLKPAILQKQVTISDYRIKKGRESVLREAEFLACDMLRFEIEFDDFDIQEKLEASENEKN